jgi:Ca2+-binding EF-hand superfamily protein
VIARLSLPGSRTSSHHIPEDRPARQDSTRIAEKLSKIAETYNNATGLSLDGALRPAHPIPSTLARRGLSINSQETTMKKLLFSAMGVALLMGTTKVIAQDNAQDLRKQLIEKYDEDGDGQLNAQEREKARAAFLKQAPEDEPEEQPLRQRRPNGDDNQRRRGRRGNFGGPGGEQFRQQLLGAFDKDGDGELSDSEEAAMREDFEKKRDAGRARFMKEYDKNGDGDIDDSEREAMRANFEKRREENRKKYDKDGDGDLNEEERRKMFEDFQTQREELTKKYDKDGNGFLTFEEEQAARKDGAEINNFGFFGGGPRGRGGRDRGGDGGGRRGNFRRGGDGEGRPRRPGGGDGNRRPQRPGQTETR